MTTKQSELSPAVQRYRKLMCRYEAMRGTPEARTKAGLSVLISFSRAYVELTDDEREIEDIEEDWREEARNND